jgi:hypothetical protein
MYRALSRDVSGVHLMPSQGFPFAPPAAMRAAMLKLDGGI